LNKKGNGSDRSSVEDSTIIERLDCLEETEIQSDEDTAELPILKVAELASSDHKAAVTDPDQTVVEAPGNASVTRAAGWVRDVEAEIGRLQKQWASVDRELAAANARNASLRDELDHKQERTAELVAQIGVLQQRIEELEAAILDKENSIAELKSEAAERASAIDAASSALNEANGRASILDDRLQAAQQDLTGLRNSLQEARGEAAELRAEKTAITEANARLRARLEELETYVDGRREQWVEQQVTIKNQEFRIASLQASFASSERQIADRNATIESLEARIVERERETGELSGRHSEREAAHREAQSLLQERAGEVERLKAQLEQQEAASGRAEIEQLRVTLEEREALVRKLEDDVSRLEAVREHIETQQQSDRDTLHQLQQEVAQLRIDGDDLADLLNDARAQIETLSGSLAAAEEASKQLTADNSTQQERIAQLEAELESRDEIIAGFDANAERLTALSRDLNALHNLPIDDEQVPSVTDERTMQDMIDAEALFDGDETEEHVETTLDITDYQLRRVKGDDHDIDDSILANLGLGGGSSVRRHAIVALADNNRSVYAISKPVTTIGRSKFSDIRIRDIVISRVHARLRVERGQLVVEDGGSKNGLTVNAKKIGRAILKHGDIVSLGGNHDFRYVELDQPMPSHTQ
jgi:chromosome segregation ATPase